MIWNETSIATTKAQGYRGMSGICRQIEDAEQKAPEDQRAVKRTAVRHSPKRFGDPVRYADDFLLGFCGPRAEAETIKQQLSAFLATELKLTLSDPKTLITHARTEAARFLGYEIEVIHNDHRRDATRRRATNGTIGLKVPMEVVTAKCRRYTENDKPVHLLGRTHNTVYSIVAQYQQEYRGIVEYYRLAYTLSTQLGRLKFVMEQSLTKTLAHKLRISVSEVYERYSTTRETPDGQYNVLMVAIPRGDKPPLVT